MITTFQHLTNPARFNGFEPGKLPPRRKQHLLYVAPQLNRAGLWKMLFQAAELDRHPDFACFVTQLLDPLQYQPLNETEITWYQILWADKIIFPFTTTPLAELFKLIRDYKPQVKIYLHIDYNFLELPADHPQRAFYSKEQETIEAIKANIKAADRVFVANSVLAEVLQKELGAHNIVIMPLLISPTLANDFALQKMVEKPKGCVRIAIAGEYDALRSESAAPVIEYLHKKLTGSDIYLIDDFRMPEPVVKQKKTAAKTKEKDKKKGKGKEKAKPEPQLVAAPPLPVIQHVIPVTERFRMLRELQPDLALIPSSGTLFQESSETYDRWLEFAWMGIPVIVQNLHFYESKMRDENKAEYGYRAATTRDWHQLVDVLSDQAKRLTMRAMAQEYVKLYFSFSFDKIKNELL